MVRKGLEARYFETSKLEHRDPVDLMQRGATVDVGIKGDSTGSEL